LAAVALAVWPGKLETAHALNLRECIRMMLKFSAIVVIVVVLSAAAGCCALPDAPGPIGIPGC
jgi:hypothetical protein